mmetsp:Transcript_18452/g.28458  ORF Transcript_18452/g.28458 Transcript_18452/m.28458 type:complete len:283 (-) Transcript_18452:88-936(-)
MHLALPMLLSLQATKSLCIVPQAAVACTLNTIKDSPAQHLHTTSVTMKQPARQLRPYGQDNLPRLRHLKAGFRIPENASHHLHHTRTLINLVDCAQLITIAMLQSDMRHLWTPLGPDCVSVMLHHGDSPLTRLKVKQMLSWRCVTQVHVIDLKPTVLFNRMMASSFSIWQSVHCAQSILHLHLLLLQKTLLDHAQRNILDLLHLLLHQLLPMPLLRFQRNAMDLLLHLHPRQLLQTNLLHQIQSRSVSLLKFNPLHLQQLLQMTHQPGLFHLLQRQRLLSKQ